MNLWLHPEFRAFSSRPLAAALTLLCRWGIAAVFLWAGTVKALDPRLFVDDVRSFQLVGDPWAAWLAMGLPWLEILTAVALLLGGWTRGACLVFTASLLLFVGVLSWAWSAGLDVSCGCFGHADNKTDYPLALGRNTLLLAATLGAWVGWSRLRKSTAPATFDRPQPAP